MNNKNDTAYLYNDDRYTIFVYKDRVIRFVTSSSLDKYTNIKKWYNGYIIVDAKYTHNKDVEEEYIDLQHLLDNLYFDTKEFLKPIKKVELRYV